LPLEHAIEPHACWLKANIFFFDASIVASMHVTNSMLLGYPLPYRCHHELRRNTKGTWTVVHGAALFADPEVMAAVLEVEEFDGEANAAAVRTTPPHIAAIAGTVLSPLRILGN
jgi:hypothetical protein